MAKEFSKTARSALGGLMAAALGLSVLSAPVMAQERTIVGERYEPTIWIDPDGCEHWVMDDGAEGFMDIRRTRDGRPVCHRNEICGVIPTDQLFETDEHWISNANKQRLMDFFNEANAFGYIIYGHTDARASDEYNMSLSQRRADMVAQVGSSTGARIVDVKGFGERQPRDTNGTAAGMQQNRRVEIYCLR